MGREYHLVAHGRKLPLPVNGKLIAGVTDNNDDSFEAAGILALQLHTGPPIKAQFKDIRLKRLAPARKPDVPETLLADAALAWQLGDRLNAHQPLLQAIGRITRDDASEAPPQTTTRASNHSTFPFQSISPAGASLIESLRRKPGETKEMPKLDLAATYFRIQGL